MKTKNYIYIYTTEESKKQGLIKIGDAENVSKRIKEQFNTAAAIDATTLKTKADFKIEAITKSGIPFRDHQIHDILVKKGYGKHQVIDEDNNIIKGSTEWFNIDIKKAIHLIESYIDGVPEEKINIDRFNSFEMRPEQEEAASITKKYFIENKNKKETPEFLWNAKMRFGKTFAAYQLVKKMDFKKTLILTYKPAVRVAWGSDLNNHIDFEDYAFLYDDNLSKIDTYVENDENIVVFASFQDLLGKKSDGSDIKDKHKTLFSIDWDILIIDEFHYGTSTDASKELLENELSSSELTKIEEKERRKNLFSDDDDTDYKEKESLEGDDLIKKSIKTNYKLFLSGTPFKALADNRFSNESIFNWTYVDEQKAKEEWVKPEQSPNAKNPYLSLPKIELYVYKVPKETIKIGQRLNKDEFSLNEFFKVEKGKSEFKDKGAVKIWLDLITGILKDQMNLEEQIEGKELERSSEGQYPFDSDSSKFNNKVNHTLWYFNRTNSAVAMAELLKEHKVFNQYHIELVTGGKTKSGAAALKPVESAIKNNKRTITITVGKLTTGVSVPEWTGVLFLRDTDSPENYFQTAFRAQTPYTDELGIIKKTCFIFDFSPNRSLKLLTTYSEKLTASTHSSSSEEKIEEFIKYLPVLKISGNKMVEMDAREVLTFDFSGLDAKGLGAKFIERKNIVVTSEVLDLINSSEENRSRCSAIFDKIKMFKKYSTGDKDTDKYDADMISLDANNGKIKKLKKRDSSDGKGNSKELDEAEKKQNDEKKKVRELLKTLLSRLPLFMYLTDATEENLEQVLVKTEDELFRKTTGININDFNYLVDMGLMMVDNIDGYVLRFNQLENENYELANKMSSK